MAWDGLAKGVKYARNGLYIGVAITTIAATGTALCQNGLTQFVCGTVTILGAAIVTNTAKNLYKATSMIQSIVNSQ